MEATSAYEAPQSSLEVDDELKLASKGQRFATYIIDIIAYYVVMFGIGIVVGIIAGATQNQSLLEFLTNFATIIALGVLFAYYAFSEILFNGKTIGKMLCKTRTVDAEGNKPKSGAIFVRSLCRFIPFEPFSVAFNGQGIGWHDSISKTKVISTK